jgi:hypothetical protein
MMPSPLDAMLPILNRYRSPSERLVHLHKDVEKARHTIEQVLNSVARRNGIPGRDVDRAIDLFADAMLEEATGNIEEKISLDVNDDEDREQDR